MKKFGQSSTDLESVKTIIEEKIVNSHNCEMVRIVCVFAMAMIVVSGVTAAAVLGFIAMENRQVVPDGCAVVDNLSACHMDEHMEIFPLGKTMIFDYSPTRVCEKKIACYDGRVADWQRHPVGIGGGE